MENNSRAWLLNYVQTHCLNDDYTFSDLFYNIYVQKMFNNVEDLINDIDDFFDFLINHANFIKKPDYLAPEKVLYFIENSRHNVKMNFAGPAFEGQKQFAEIATKITPNPENKSLLDVGPGHFAISSLFLAKKFKRVTAMDACFFLSLQALKNMNVCALSEYYRKTTDISDYDIVVGRAPCTAIKPIVTTCSKAKKPYFLQLCDCDLPAEYKSDTDGLGWEHVLKKVDKGITFYKTYAFNPKFFNPDALETLKQFTAVPKKCAEKYNPPKKEPSKVKSLTVKELEDMMIFE